MAERMLQLDASEAALMTALSTIEAAVDSICPRDECGFTVFKLAPSGFSHDGTWPPHVHRPVVFVNIGWVDECRALEVLQIAVAAALCSRALSVEPATKIAFWQALLAPMESPHKLLYMEQWLAHDSRVPHIVLDYRQFLDHHFVPPDLVATVRGRRDTPTNARRNKVELDDEANRSLVAALLQGLTIQCDSLSGDTLAARSLLAAHAFAEQERLAWTIVSDAMPPIDVGLFLPGRTRPATHVLAFLDRMTAEYATRQIRISSIQFDKLVVSEVDASTIAELVAKSYREHDVEDLEVGALCREVPTKPLFALALAVFPRTVRAVHDSTSGSIVAPPRPLSLSLSLHSLQHFAAMCSALRYGCPYSELYFTRSMDDMSESESSQCWQWLAFSIFCARASIISRTRGECKLRIVDLSDTPMRPTDAWAFAAALQSPVRAMQSHMRDVLESIDDDSDSNRIGVCVLKASPKIYATRSARATNLICASSLASETLEVLGDSVDGWYLVVVPGLGLGWVPERYIQHIDWDATTSTRQSMTRPQLALALDLRCDPRMRRSMTFGRLFEVVGPQLQALAVRWDPMVRDRVLEPICTHCQHLEHLSISAVQLNSREMLALAHALHAGRFNQQLVTLELRAAAIDTPEIAELMAALSDATRIPRLQELRLRTMILAPHELALLLDMLRVNKTLERIDLTMPPGRDDMPEYADVCAYMDAAFQHEWLASAPLAMRSKAAFLSVIKHSRRAAVSALDAFVASLVFQFAATNVRRKILWTGF